MLDPTGRYYNIFMGCIMGGAFGDALGFPVEFMQLSEIVEHYGRQGIVKPQFGPNQKALVSDDTQMVLFGMDGLTEGIRLRRSGAADADAEIFLDLAYLDWYATQQSRIRYTHPFTAIYTDHRLKAQRAPGKTCMSALSQQFIAAQGTGEEYNVQKRGTMEKPFNASKGCGSVMRPADPTLERLAANAVYQVEQQFRGLKDLPEFIALMEKAMELAATPSITTGKSLSRLGKGETCESVLAMSLYLTLRYQNDYFTAIHAAVNQNGDSDTAGSVTGNLLGAWLGYEAISYQLDCVYGMQDFLGQHLEMHDLILDTVRRAWHTAILGDH